MICSDCGAKSICLYNVDGTVDSICIACVKEARDVGAAHAYAIRIHFLAHQHNGEGCPKCQLDDAERLLWPR